MYLTHMHYHFYATGLYLEAAGLHFNKKPVAQHQRYASQSEYLNTDAIVQVSSQADTTQLQHLTKPQCRTRKGQS